MQLTVRMPDEYTEKLRHQSAKMGIKRSDIVRLALKRFLETDHEVHSRAPFQKVERLRGIAEIGITDRGKYHRRHLIQKMKQGG